MEKFNKSNIAHTQRRDYVPTIIEQMKNHKAPWQRPWSSEESGAPFNPVSNAIYKSFNRLILSTANFEDPRWMTRLQAGQLNLRLKEQSSSQQLEFWRWSNEAAMRDGRGNIVKDRNGNPVIMNLSLIKPQIRRFEVFNLSQMEAPAGAALAPWRRTRNKYAPVELVETIIEKSKAAINFLKVDKASYDLYKDVIITPPKSDFSNHSEYYSTILHELAHWTRHPSRLGRDSGKVGDRRYAQEELRVEIAAWMLCQDLGLDFVPENSDAYISDWIKIFNDDPTEIAKACLDAERIRDFLSGYAPKQEMEASDGEQIFAVNPIAVPDQIAANDQIGVSNQIVVPERIVVPEQITVIDQAAVAEQIVVAEQITVINQVAVAEQIAVIDQVAAAEQIVVPDQVAVIDQISVSQQPGAAAQISEPVLVGEAAQLADVAQLSEPTQLGEVAQLSEATQLSGAVQPQPALSVASGQIGDVATGAFGSAPEVSDSSLKSSEASSDAPAKAQPISDGNSPCADCQDGFDNGPQAPDFTQKRLRLVNKILGLIGQPGLCDGGESRWNSVVTTVQETRKEPWAQDIGFLNFLGEVERISDCELSLYHRSSNQVFPTTQEREIGVINGLLLIVAAARELDYQGILFPKADPAKPLFEAYSLIKDAQDPGRSIRFMCCGRAVVSHRRCEEGETPMAGVVVRSSDRCAVLITRSPQNAAELAQALNSSESPLLTTKREYWQDKLCKGSIKSKIASNNHPVPTAGEVEAISQRIIERNLRRSKGEDVSDPLFGSQFPHIKGVSPDESSQQVTVENLRKIRQEQEAVPSSKKPANRKAKNSPPEQANLLKVKQSG
ncbi:MAG: ssDNA-binding domain-containing protein [Deltaproteobacteria bacterium]|jgi:antirestriction protein ArdC|nr:ssDNA-binding domain-containing protein [Deltaproteobacteria bacterium]